MNITEDEALNKPLGFLSYPTAPHGICYPVTLNKHKQNKVLYGKKKKKVPLVHIDLEKRATKLQRLTSTWEVSLKPRGRCGMTAADVHIHFLHVQSEGRGGLRGSMRLQLHKRGFIDITVTS